MGIKPILADCLTVLIGNLTAMLCIDAYLFDDVTQDKFTSSLFT